MVALAAVLYFAGRVLPRSWQRLNTDFPNYYVTARLQREGYSTARVYEWIWLQRQKDRMGIRRSEQPLVGFIPHTPFSALLLQPLTAWPPLTAKHIWIVINLLLLATVAVQLHSLTALSWRRIILVIGLNYPLFRNLEYGQYYLLLLFLMVSALLLYQNERRFGAGVLLGIASALKIFPVFFLLYFARKRDLRGMLGLLAGAVACLLIAVRAFGLQLHLTYLTEVLPWALRGEAMDPYNLASNSFSSLLHRLFLFEPGWNPHPLIHAPIVFAILHPLLQLALLLPVLYLVNSDDHRSTQVQLEWSMFLVVLLAISTLPSSYHFTLLILPAAVLWAAFLHSHDYRAAALLLTIYIAICFPSWPHTISERWWALIAAPRLYFMVLLCLLCYLTVARRRQAIREWRGSQWMVAGTLSFLFMFEAGATLHHQHRLYSGYSSRIIGSATYLLATSPAIWRNRIDFIAMSDGRYIAVGNGAQGAEPYSSAEDQLSQSSNTQKLWIEESGYGDGDRIISKGPSLESTSVEAEGGQSPVASPDGKWLAYLRSPRGRGTIWLRDLSHNPVSDRPVTPPGYDVEEMTFLPTGTLIFSAATTKVHPQLYVMGQDGVIQALSRAEARYPAASPDGRWLTYSQLQGGVWNLWIRDLRAGTTRRLTDEDCNDMSPLWEPDSKTLVYASDCGRALWFTALHLRRVIP